MKCRASCSRGGSSRHSCRAVVRATFERRFSVEVMAAKYEGAYADIISRNDTRRLRIAATKDRKLAPESALPRGVPVIPLAGRA